MTHHRSAENYNSAHSATRDALGTLESYVRALEEDVAAREALLKALQQYTGLLERSTVARRTELDHAHGGLRPAISTLKAALMQPPPAGIPAMEAPAPAAAAAAGHEAYTPAPAAGGAALPPNVLAVLAQLAPAAASLLGQPQAPPASADAKPGLGWLPLQQ